MEGEIAENRSVAKVVTPSGDGSAKPKLSPVSHPFHSSPAIKQSPLNLHHRGDSAFEQHIQFAGGFLSDGHDFFVTERMSGETGTVVGET